MALYIIVPHYKEEKEVYSPLFNCLNTQEGIDFNKIHLVIGQSSVEAFFPDMKEWENLKDRTTYICKLYEKEAAGSSREGALEWVKGQSKNPDDYLIFCDCDDSLCTNHSLADIFADVEAHKGVD